MAEVVNLRRKRKAKARGDAAAQAAENRASFGRAKSEKTLTNLLHSKNVKNLDAHKREPE